MKNEEENKKNETQPLKEVDSLKKERGEEKSSNPLKHNKPLQGEMPQPQPQPQPQGLGGRRVIIETDGNSVRIISADVAGSLELKAILLRLLEDIR